MLKPLALHILLVLAVGDSHGYAIMRAIREQSAGEVSVHTASFYRHLARLIDDGLVAEAAARRQAVDPRRGASYRITTRGRQALADEKQRLRQLVARFNRVRLTPRKADT